MELMWLNVVSQHGSRIHVCPFENEHESENLLFSLMMFDFLLMNVVLIQKKNLMNFVFEIILCLNFENLSIDI